MKYSQKLQAHLLVFLVGSVALGKINRAQKSIWILDNYVLDSGLATRSALWCFFWPPGGALCLRVRGVLVASILSHFLPHVTCCCKKKTSGALSESDYWPTIEYTGYIKLTQYSPFQDSPAYWFNTALLSIRLILLYKIWLNTWLNLDLRKSVN